MTAIDLDNIKESAYRLVIAVKYELQIVYIRFMGTHAEYDAKYLGGRSRASEVLNRKRKLTVEMMRSLSKHLHIPVESLSGSGLKPRVTEAGLVAGDFFDPFQSLTEVFETDPSSACFIFAKS